MDEHGRRSLGAPKRLSRGDPASLETRLVRAAQAEAPPAGASGRALVALGLGTAAATSVAAGSAAASTATAAAAKAAAGKGFLGAGLSTWITGGVIAVAATGGVVALDGSTAQAPAPIVSTAPPSVKPRVETRSPVPVLDPTPIPSAHATVDEEPPTTEPGVLAAPTVPSPRGSAAPAASVPAGPSALSREVELIDGARAALAEGDAARALSTLDRYDREHRGGVLAPEAALLRTKARAKIAPPQ